MRSSGRSGVFPSDGGRTVDWRSDQVEDQAGLGAEV